VLEALLGPVTGRAQEDTREPIPHDIAGGKFGPRFGWRDIRRGRARVYSLIAAMSRTLSRHLDPDRPSARGGWCTAAPRFRTIQVCPKDLPVPSGQPWPAVS
jgi:hypothetical protein